MIHLKKIRCKRLSALLLALVLVLGMMPSGVLSVKADDSGAGNTDPTVSIELLEATWENQFISKITFGIKDYEKQALFSKEDVAVELTATNWDEAKYIVKEYASGKQELNEFDEAMVAEYAEWASAEKIDGTKSITVEASDTTKNVVVYVRGEKDGVYQYFSTDGFVIDAIEPTLVLEPENPTNINYQNTDMPLYTSESIEFGVAVNEEDVAQVLQSGIQKVLYKVETKDPSASEYSVKIGDTLLFQWDDSAELSKEYTGKLTFDSSKYMNKFVKLTVKAFDNAGNSFSQSYEFAVDPTSDDDAGKPNVEIKVNDTVFKNHFLTGLQWKDNFFNKTPTVQIVVTDEMSGLQSIEYCCVKYANNDTNVPLIPPADKWVQISENITYAKSYTFNLTAYETGDVSNLVIYVRAVDMVGNEVIYTTDGILIDKKKPAGNVEIVEEEKTTVHLVYPKEKPCSTVKVNNEELPLFGPNEIKDGKLVFDVKATENDVENSYQSGIKSLTYTISVEKYSDANGVLYEYEESADINRGFAGTIEIDTGLEMYKNAVITLKVTVIDNAGNTLEETYKCGVDRSDESGDAVAVVSLDDFSWNQLLENAAFGKEGLFFNGKKTIKLEVSDDFSGVEKVEYFEWPRQATAVEINEELIDKYIVDNADKITVFNEAEIKDKEGQLTVEIAEDNKNVVLCLRVTDRAGNIRYYATDGMIFDKIAPNKGRALITPQVVPANTVPNSTKPLYGKDDITESGEILFDIDILEASEKENVSPSGFKSVSYKVEAKDRAEDEYKATIEETFLYQWDKKELVTSIDETIAIVAVDHNYNYVKLTVKAEDNAGNVTEQIHEFAVDITEPTVSIEYDNNYAVREDAEFGYYTDERTATITYQERSENWSQENAEKYLVEALDITGKKVENAYTISWTDVKGDLSDQDLHIATVYFTSTANNGADARYSIDTTYTDAAGNTTLDTNYNYEVTKNPFSFVIDSVSPTIEKIEYEQRVDQRVINAITFNYFNSNVTVTVTMRDKTSGVLNFDYAGLLAAGVSLKNEAVLRTAVEQTEIKQNENKKDIFVVTFQIPKTALTELNSFNGVIEANAYDYCDNSVVNGEGVPGSGDRLVVDKIAPKCKVTIDPEKPTSEDDGISYFDGPFTATIVINEANFYKEDVKILVNDERVRPKNWVKDGDKWTCQVDFTEEDDYVLKVDYTDRSGNVMKSYESNQMTLDMTEPAISVSNLKHESANNTDVISFDLTVVDKNIKEGSIAPELMATVRELNENGVYEYKTIPIDFDAPSQSTNAKGEIVYTYSVKNLEIDGYYALICEATDLANHIVDVLTAENADGSSAAISTMNFSVNRDGSTFAVMTRHNDKYATDAKLMMENKLNGAYANDQVEIIVVETNVDEVDVLEDDDMRTVLVLNDGTSSHELTLGETSQDGVGYELNKAERKGNGGWFKTTYTIRNAQFKQDGTYSFNLISYDKASNSNVNTKSDDGMVEFVLDRTNPVVNTNVQSEDIIDRTEYTVEVQIADANLDASTVEIKHDGEVISAQEVGNNTYQFVVKEIVKQNYTIYAKDKAGNETGVYEISDLTVSANFLLRLYANTALFWSLVGGIIVLVGIFFIILLKKNKKEDEEA